MFEDLSFASGTKPLLMDIAAYSAKNLQADADTQPHMSRRPRPRNLVHAGTQQFELPFVPRPPPGTAATSPAKQRPFSVPRPLIGSSLVKLAGDGDGSHTDRNAAQSEADMLRIDLHELQKKYEQSRDLAQLQQQLIRNMELEQPGHTNAASKISVGVELQAGSVQRACGTACMEQSCQTEERAFTEQLDQILRDGAQKSKDMRRLQETVQTLRAELHQEKLISEQYRDTSEVLEEQLRKTLQNQHRAAAEKTLADWHLRQAGTRQSRSATTQPQSARARKAWADANLGRSTSNATDDACAKDACRHGPKTATGRALQQYDYGGDEEQELEGSEDESRDSDAESAVSSDSCRHPAVFHPPNSHR